MKLAQALDGRANNIDLLRLIAALMVIYGHSPAMTGLSGFDPTIMLTERTDYSGSLAIKFFFFASGLVVTNSLMRNNAPLPWGISRLFRIVPAYVLLMAVTVFIIGPLTTAWSIADYLGSTGPYHYAASNISALARNCCMIWDIPSLFEGNIRATVNGSLWTLPSEMYCYLFVFLVAVIGCFKLPKSALAALLFVYVVAATIYPDYLNFTSSATAKRHLFQCFVAGMIFAVLRDYIALRWDIAGALVIIAALSRGFPFFEAAYILAMVYGALVVAVWPPIVRLKPKYDVSYGVYLYGWPVQQTVVHFAPSMTLWVHFIVAASISILLGLISWKLIEDRSIQWGKMIGRFRLFGPPLPSNNPT